MCVRLVHSHRVLIILSDFTVLVALLAEHMALGLLNIKSQIKHNAILSLGRIRRKKSKQNMLSLAGS